MIDLAVVGGGVMGAPAAFFAVRAGASVAVLAPPEPIDPANHRGPFGAHYDQSRLVWRLHTDPVGSALAVRSIEHLRDLERITGVAVTTARPVLFAAAPGVSDQQLAAATTAQARRYGIEPADASSVAGRWPEVALPPDSVGYVEPEPAGLLDPRRVVNTYLDRCGADVRRTAAREIEVTRSGCRVRTDSGDDIWAARVLLATGAFSNAAGLLPRPLGIRLKSESVVFAELDSDQGRRFSAVPPMRLDLRPGDVAEIYTTPAMQTADGRWRLKLGANTRRDRWLPDAETAADWYRRPAVVSALPMLRGAMRRLYPQLDAHVWRTERCTITYTAHGRPYVDEVVPGRMYVATGGNGHAAKWGPALGELAADLALTGDWRSDLPTSWFQVVFEDAVLGWAGPELLADR